MMSLHSFESGIHPGTTEVDMEAGLVAEALVVITVAVAALVAATGQLTTPTAI